MLRQDIKPLFDALQTNLSISHGATENLQDGLLNLKDELKRDISKREYDLGNLSYLARDIRDNFQFTLSLVDEINVIDELINQINILALNTAIEASKVEGENEEVFGELAKDIREKSDKVQGVIERIFTKEVKNKSFSEHNRYIQNSVLSLINERVESLGDYLNIGDELLKDIKKLEDIVRDISHSNSNNRDIFSSLFNSIDQPEEESSITVEETQEIIIEDRDEVVEERVYKKVKSQNREVERYIPEF